MAVYAFCRTAVRSETNETSKIKSRPSDVYVFCLLNHKDKNGVNPLILDQWIFYVVSKKNVFRNKNTIQLISLEKIVKGVNYYEIKVNVVKEYSENNDVRHNYA